MDSERDSVGGSKRRATEQDDVEVIVLSMPETITWRRMFRGTPLYPLVRRTAAAATDGSSIAASCTAAAALV